MQYLLPREVCKEAKDSECEEKCGLEPIAFLDGLDERDAEKDNEHRYICE
jgi:hypothetical protein